MILIRYQMDAFHLIWICDGVNVIELSLSFMYTQCNTSIYIYIWMYSCIHFYMLISIGMHRIVPRRITIAIGIAITIKRRTFRVAKFWIFSYYVLKTYCKCARNTWNELNAIKRCSLLSFFNNFSQHTMCSNIYGCMHECLSFQWKCILMLAIEYVMHVLHFRTT